MKDKHEITIPEKEFKNGIEKYAEKVKLEFYNCAVFTVDRYWSSSEYTDILEIAYALKNFLLTSDTRFYGKGSFDLDKLPLFLNHFIMCFFSRAAISTMILFFDL